MNIISTIILILLSVNLHSQFYCDQELGQVLSNRSIDCFDNGTEDQGNFMYLPDANWGLITIPVNIWVMQPTTIQNNQFENTAAHRNYLRTVVEAANGSLYRRSDNYKEVCNPGNTVQTNCVLEQANATQAPAMIDTRIELELNMPIRFVVDDIGFTNNGIGPSSNSTNNYLINTYLNDQNGNAYPEFDDALNIFFCDIPGRSTSGWGPGLWGEDTNYVLLNSRFDEYLDPSWSVYSEGIFLAHEVNHCLGMPHTDALGNNNPFGYTCAAVGESDSNHNMHGGSTCKPIYLSPITSAHLRKNLYSTWRKKLAKNLPDCPEFIFEADHTVGPTEDLVYCGDVIIPDGVVLTVEGCIRMFPNKRIIVERGGVLFMDGGHILSCDEEWQGIIVEGVPGDIDNAIGEAGKVVLSNEAIIENAKIAISMNPKHIGWACPDWVDTNNDGIIQGDECPEWTSRPDMYYGGYVSAENSTIRNCRRGVDFMRHAQGGVTDKSSFTDVTFENIRDSGVTIWASDGIQFIDCTFNNLGIGSGNTPADKIHEGIRAEQAWVDVDDCVFDVLPYGVVLEGTDILSDIMRPSSIINSDFNATKTGVELMTYEPLIDPTLSGRTGNLIENNEFLSGETGVKVDQRSRLQINGNTFFTTEYGIKVSTGMSDDYANRVNGNLFQGIEQACVFEGENGDLQFWTNCFEGTPSAEFPDVKVTGQMPVQGSEEVEAGNKFTKGGKMEITSTANFDYHVEKTRVAGETEFLDNSSASIAQRIDAEEPNEEECGAMFAPNPDPEYCSEHLSSISEILSLLDEIEGYKSGIENYKELHRLSRLKVALYKQLSIKVGAQNEESDAILNEAQMKSRLRIEPEFDLRSFVPSISIRNSEYQKAKAELASVITDNAEESNYLESQNIYIDFLISGRIEVNPSQLQFLRNVGSQEGRLNAYARTILHIVSGERIEQSSSEVAPQLGNRERTVSDNARKVACYPNPIQQSTYYVSISEMDSALYNYSLSDMKGNRLRGGSLESNEVKAIDCTNISAGIYLLMIEDEQENVIHHERVVIID